MDIWVNPEFGEKGARNRENSVKDEGYGNPYQPEIQRSKGKTPIE